MELHAIRYGDAHPARFVLVHGLASAARLWDGVGLALAERGHGAIAVDLRGHGESPKPVDGYDFDTVVRDLVPYLVDAPVLVGQSYGGNLVVEVAARHPALVRAIACVDGGAIDLRARFDTLEDALVAMRPPYEQFEGITVAQEEAYLRRSHPDWPESGIQGALAVNEHLPDGTIKSRLGWARHQQIICAMWDQRPSELFLKIDVPVLFLVSSERMRPGVEAATEVLANGRAVYFDGADHDLHAQRPVEVAEQLVSLL